MSTDSYSGYATIRKRETEKVQVFRRRYKNRKYATKRFFLGERFKKN
jgi:hypothetical protein